MLEKQIVIKEVKQVLDRTGIFWALSHGALLGIVREGDFIAWDTDIDLALKEEEARPRAQDLIQRFGAVGYRVKARKKNGHEFALAAKKGGQVLNLAYWRQEGPLRIYKDSYFIPDRFFKGAGEVEYRGQHYPCLGPAKDYLTWLYGPTWTVPKKSSSGSRSTMTKRALDIKEALREEANR